MIKAVTFDCAQTLIKVDWQPAVVAVKSAKAAGLDFDMAPAAEVYDRKLRSRWPEFQELNKSRDRTVLDKFWRELTEDWLNESGIGVDHTDAVLQRSEAILFGEGSRVFQVFDDVVPCLERLVSEHIKLAVISNWDNSLHRTLAMFELGKYFDVVLASLEEGIEKPEPALFEIAINRLGLAPSEILHVGDNPVDDWQGAKGAGMQALLIDRLAELPSKLVITGLEQLPGAIGL